MIVSSVGPCSTQHAHPRAWQHSLLWEGVCGRGFRIPLKPRAAPVIGENAATPRMASHTGFLH